jgi:hypothetical protein
LIFEFGWNNMSGRTRVDYDVLRIGLVLVGQQKKTFFLRSGLIAARLWNVFCRLLGFAFMCFMIAPVVMITPFASAVTCIVSLKTTP